MHAKTFLLIVGTVVEFPDVKKLYSAHHFCFDKTLCTKQSRDILRSISYLLSAVKLMIRKYVVKEH